ncbi:MAG: hypothetical protein V1656_01405, partial [Candidatus Jorgensenbacteria bacterium]
MEEKTVRGIEVSLPRVEFGFDEAWEAENWYSTFTKKVAYGLKDGQSHWDLGDIPPEMAAVVVRNKSEPEALAAIKTALERFLKEPHTAETIEKTIARAERRWG